MAETRKFLLARRQAGIGDLSTTTPQSGGIDAWSDDFLNMVAKNNVYQIGIGTESEVGLEVTRYPIRVVLTGGTSMSTDASVCIKFWSVVNAKGDGVLFDRTGGGVSTVVKNIYKSVDNLDAVLQEAYLSSKDQKFALHTELTPIANLVFATASLPNPTPEQFKEIAGGVEAMLIKAKELKLIPFFRVSANLFWLARRHGVRDKADRALEAIVRSELNATFLVNYERLHKSYPEVNTGLKTVCAYAIAWYFSVGLYETYESKEYVTLRVDTIKNEAAKFMVAEQIAPEGYAWDESLSLGKVIDCVGLKHHTTVTKVGPSLVYLSGVNHYSFNHTTGGQFVGGPMLSNLMMYQLFDTTAANNLEEAQTRMLYETLHPTNKRGIANMFFRDCNVFTWGRAHHVSPMQVISADQFLNVRDRPVPAGAHKAYLAGTVLSRVLSQKYAIFLPWAGSIPSVIGLIETVVRSGAKCHVGATYYTGAPGVAQGAALDQYLPELAQYIHIMAPRDTLALSPHLSADVATRSDPNWTALLRSIKGNDVSAVSVDVVKEYLSSTGTFISGFDENNPTTWPKVAADSAAQARALEELMKLG
jgi:hypothetical protein